jgi:hypothetical protein
VEFSVKVGIIFNETFMMRGSVINKTNIDHFQPLMSSTLEYFETWRTRQLQLRTLDDKEWKRKFLSPITYLHLRIGIAGFFSYVRIVLNEQNGPSYVPFLHSNSSTIEAWFSMVRGAKQDTPVGYRGAVGAMDVTRQANGSGMYKDGGVEDDEGGESIFE